MGHTNFVGTTRKTWLEAATGRVGRRYEPEKEPQVIQIHNLCRQLHLRGVPIQLPLGPPMMDDGGYLVAYYAFKEDDGPSEYRDGWYCPKITSQRRRNAARTFALFQRAALELVGPDTPLDYPFCNTLHWTATHDQPRVLLGPWATAEADELLNLIDEFRRLIKHLLSKAEPVLRQSPWGLCHGDFHDGNTIFRGDRLVHIVDFGCWIQHPLVFDLAIAVEFWGRDYSSDEFRLNPEFVAEFLQAYTGGRGPLDVTPNLLAVSAMARLWIETHRIRSRPHPDGLKQVTSHMRRIVLPRLRWYAEHEGTL